MNVALFRRALSNLLQNAIEHSRPGARLVVHDRRSARGAIWIAVANPGEPIAETHLPRLFDRFYRVDASRHDAGEPTATAWAWRSSRRWRRCTAGGVGARSDDGVTTIGFSVPRAAPS